jgi:predicted alpha-1,2-mannosidase
VYLEFDQAPSKIEKSNRSVVLSFAPALKKISARYGVSYISVEQAQKNLRSEITDFDLNRLAANGHKEWNRALGKIQLDGNNENAKTGFFHPKDANGNFIEPFDYVWSGGRGSRDYYDENHGWIYRWSVQHNIADLINLMGGREKFSAALDTPLDGGKVKLYSQLPDHTGNVGKFSMGNEPSFHIPYLYNYAGQPWKTQKRIRSLIDQWYRNDLMVIPGDEDGGGMSAFVVFSMMGFYPVTPGIPAYNIGSPFFEKITVKLTSGKKLVISTKNCSKENKYIQSAKLNGKPLNQPWFWHHDIANGRTLEFLMSERPNKSWGNPPSTAPPSGNP